MLGRLVEDEQAALGEQQSGEGQPLTLTAGHGGAVRAEVGVEPSWQAREPACKAHAGEHGPQVVVGRARVTQAEVLAHGRVKDMRVLRE